MYIYQLSLSFSNSVVIRRCTNFSFGVLILFILFKHVFLFISPMHCDASPISKDVMTINRNPVSLHYENFVFIALIPFLTKIFVCYLHCIRVNFDKEMACSIAKIQPIKRIRSMHWLMYRMKFPQSGFYSVSCHSQCPSYYSEIATDDLLMLN